MKKFLISLLMLVSTPAFAGNTVKIGHHNRYNYSFDRVIVLDNTRTQWVLFSDGHGDRTLIYSKGTKKSRPNTYYRFPAPWEK